MELSGFSVLLVWFCYLSREFFFGDWVASSELQVAEKTHKMIQEGFAGEPARIRSVSRTSLHFSGAFLVIERVPVLSGVGRKKGRVPKEDKIGRTWQTKQGQESDNLPDEWDSVGIRKLPD